MTPTQHTTPAFDLVCATHEATLSAGTREIVLIPAGRVETDQGAYVLDHEGARMVIDVFLAHGTDLPIDFEHSTVYKADYGEPAPAVGWIKALRFDERRGLIGSVEWTDEGREAIQSGKYKYLSPVMAVRKKDGRVTALHSAALTNKPAIPRMEQLAASQSAADFLLALAGDQTGYNPPESPTSGGGDPDPDPGPAAAASDPKVANLIRGLLAKLRDALGLSDGASAQDVLAALGKFIEAKAEAESDPVAMRAMLRAEIEADLAVERAVDEQVQAGKLLCRFDSQMEWARSLARHDLGAFQWLMEHAPRVGPPQGRTTPPEEGEGAAQRLTVMRQAAREFQASKELQRLTTERAYMNMKLREAGLQPCIERGEELRY